MLNRLLRSLTNRIYESNVRLRLQALGLTADAARVIVRTNRELDPPADLERVVKIVTFLVGYGYLKPGFDGATQQDVSAAMAFALLDFGGKNLAAFMAAR